ncbi:MAG: hypothetical protein V2I97_17125 [Desulfococcaceae bacterium]|jgi:hypothetical protein|nr:hypothetical protein [Desulfococcaceae bacterium]
MTENNAGYKNMLSDDSDFLDFIQKEARSDDFRILKEKTEDGAHPSPEMLYDYVLGWSDEKDTERVMDHIAFCGICAKEVMQIRAVENDADGEKTVSEKIFSWKKIWKKTRERLQSYRFTPLQLIPAAAVGMAACLLVWLWGDRPVSRLDKMISRSYHLEFLQAVPDGNILLPWEKADTAYGFTSPHSLSEASGAFGAGLWTGRQILGKSELSEMPEFLTPGWQKRGAEEWTETPWDVYFQMGKWCLLLNSLSSSAENIPASFWEKQVETVDYILTKYESAKEKGAENPKIVRDTLNTVREACIQLKTQPEGKKIRKKLAYELENLITYISPKQIPESENK